MVGRCLSCQAPVADGVEVCEICRTTQIPKLNLDSLSGPTPNVLAAAMHPGRERGEELDEVPFTGRGEALGRLAALDGHSLTHRP